MIEIFILSLIQGIAEFLPVSSSSHLIIASDYLELEKKNFIIIEINNVFIKINYNSNKRP